MALQKQNVDIAFAQGIDTKTDPNRVALGKLISLQNVVLTEGMAFNKRLGYLRLASLTQGVGLANFQDELITFDGSNLQSYSPSTETLVSKGTVTSVDLSVESIYRSSSSQTTQDSAFNSVGVYLHVWVDSVAGAQYAVYSSMTGNQVIQVQTLPTTAVFPKAWSLGNYVLITYIDTATNSLRYISIPVYNLTPSAPVDLSTQVDPTNRFYEGVIANDSLYLSWNASDATGAIRTTYIDSQLNQRNTNIQATEEASVCISVFADESISIPNIYVAYYNGSSIRYFIVSSNGLSPVLSPTAVATVASVINITGFATGNVGTLFYQRQNTYSYSSVRTDFITQVTATVAGVIGTPTNFLRSVGLVSKPFVYGTTRYLVVAYNGTTEPTYFVVNESGTVIAKLAYTNAGGYTANANLTKVNEISTTSFQFSYLIKASLETQNGITLSNIGVNSAFLNFSFQNVFETEELGQNLNIAGGILWSYDGYGPVEQNFHLFPEDIALSATTGSTGIFGNTYSYVALYEWTDNQGNIHKSGYAAPSTISFANATTAITAFIPTLRLTQKTGSRSNVQITLYRNAPTVAPTIFYKVSSIASPTLNSTTADFVRINDRANDAEIIGNQLLYTTGGVLPNTGGPAACAATTYKNRIVLVDAQNRDQFFYSKQIGQATPVEMVEEFTFYVDPRFGKLHAVSVMDDKLILFKPNAIFYLVGEGPDSTGANNDFTEAVFITETVGTTNPKSIVYMPDGLMFQSNKGIWLLTRSLEVFYIGADVEDFNSYTVTSARLVPNTTQVRFTLSNGICLVYDYFFKQWGWFTGVNAVAAVNAQGTTYTYLSPAGKLMQETSGIYTDDGVPYFMQLTTSWLSLAGFQGFQRLYQLFFKGKFLNAHILRVSVAYDFNAAATQTAVLRPTQLANANYGDDPYYGSTRYYGGYSQEEQYQINLIRQKCQSLQISIQEALDTLNPVYGPAIVLEAIGALVGVKSSYPRLPASQRTS